MNQQLTLVLGATGKTGRRVADQLQKLGQLVRRGSRSAPVRFDWEDDTTWRPVLQGVTSVYLTFQPDAGFPGAADTIGAFAKRAAEAGVEHIVFLAGRGEQGALRSERAVQESGVAWTIIRAAFFAQNFSEDFLVESVQSGLVAFPAGEVLEPFVHADDIADVAVAALTDIRHRGQIYELTGPRLLTFETAVSEIAKASRRELRYLPLTLPQFRDGMVEHGVPTKFAELLTGLFAEVLDGRNAGISTGVQQALGRAPRDFAEYARTTAATGIWNVK